MYLRNWHTGFFDDEEERENITHTVGFVCIYPDCEDWIWSSGDYTGGSRMVCI